MPSPGFQDGSVRKRSSEICRRAGQDSTARNKRINNTRTAAMPAPPRSSQIVSVSIVADWDEILCFDQIMYVLRAGKFNKIPSQSFWHSPRYQIERS